MIGSHVFKDLNVVVKATFLASFRNLRNWNNYVTAPYFYTLLSYLSFMEDSLISKIFSNFTTVIIFYNVGTESFPKISFHSLHTICNVVSFPQYFILTLRTISRDFQLGIGNKVLKAFSTRIFVEAWVCKCQDLCGSLFGVNCYNFPHGSQMITTWVTWVAFLGNLFDNKIYFLCPISYYSNFHKSKVTLSIHMYFMSLSS